jgi:hypothetical protein
LGPIPEKEMHGRMLTRITLAASVSATSAWLTLTAGAAAAASSPGTTTATKAHHASHPIGDPTLGFPESWGLTRRDLLDIGAGLLIALLLVVILALRVRRRRRARVNKAPAGQLRSFPQTAEAWRGSGLAEEPTGSLPKFQASSVVLPEVKLSPGWHPVQGDRTRIAYWDGSRWSAYLNWDGRQWVDPTKHLSTH